MIGKRTLVSTLIVFLFLGIGVVQAQETLTLRWADWNPAHEVVVPVCEEQLGIDIEFELYEPAAEVFFPTLAALAAAGDMPDVVAVNSGLIDEWVIDGLLINLQDRIDRDIMPQAENYFTGSFSQARFPDKTTGDMYAFPQVFVQTVLYYNQDLFDAAGVEYPTREWTWDDFLQAAQALTTEDGDGDGFPDQYGYRFWGRYAHLESWIFQNNGSLLNPTKTRFAPDEAAVETLEFLASLVLEHGVAPRPADVEGSTLADDFVEGRVAMFIDGSFTISSLLSGFGEDSTTRWAIAPVPRGPQWEQDIAYGWPDMVGISRDSEHPDEAWEVIKCITGPALTLDAMRPGDLPVYRASAEAELLEAYYPAPPNIAFLLEWADFTGPNAFTPGWAEWRGYVGGAGLEGQYDEVLNGNIDLATALSNAEAAANAVLARYYPNE